MKTWILSANPSYYDHDAAFLDYGYMDWRQTRNFSIGDTVYVYCTRPLSRIMYKTEVVSTDSVPPNDRYWRVKHDLPEGARYMRLKLIRRLDTDDLSLDRLKEHGMDYAPQSPCLAKKETLNYLHERFGE